MTMIHRNRVGSITYYLALILLGAGVQQRMEFSLYAI